MESTVAFEYWFHPAAAIELPSGEFPQRISNERIRDVAAAFLANATRVVQAATAPIEIVFWSRIQQTAIDEACLEVWGDLAPRKQDDPLKFRFDEVMARLRQEFLEQVEQNPNEHAERLFLAAVHLEGFQRGNVEIREGLAAVLRGMVTGMWTAFEVLASDLWEEALNAHPKGLAELKGKSPKSAQAPKGPFTALGPEEGTRDSAKMVKLSYLQTHSYDLSKLMGTVLREKYNFQVLDGIRRAYTEAFDQSRAAVREAILDESLTALSAVRNVLVHRAGIVDDEFMEDRLRCKELMSAFPAVELKKPLPMTGLTVHSLIHPVVVQSVKLIEGVAALAGTE